jgi:hypothetical protein
MAPGFGSRIRERWSIASRKQSKAAEFSGSPMCWPQNASFPRVRQTVFFNSPPTAGITGIFSRRATGPGRVRATYESAARFPPRNAPPNHRKAAECRDCAPKTHRRCRPAVPQPRDCRWRSALRSHFRWSSPALLTFPRRRADDASACRAEKFPYRFDSARRIRESRRSAQTAAWGEINVSAGPYAAGQNFKTPVRPGGNLANHHAGDLRQRGSFLRKA